MKRYIPVNSIGLDICKHNHIMRLPDGTIDPEKVYFSIKSNGKSYHTCRLCQLDYNKAHKRKVKIGTKTIKTIKVERLIDKISHYSALMLKLETAMPWEKDSIKFEMNQLLNK
jgi:hypothetical protein